MDISILLEIVVASGLLTAISQTVLWYLGRGKAKVDSAKVVQGMALDLLRPLHTELERANHTAADCRAKLRRLETEIEIVIEWAVAVRLILDHNHLDYPTVPEIIVARDEARRR